MEGTSPGYAPDEISCNHGMNIDPEGFVVTITTVGIDLAKNVFAVPCHPVDSPQGHRAVDRRTAAHPARLRLATHHVYHTPPVVAVIQQ